jgi:ribosomal protein L20
MNNNGRNKKHQSGQNNGLNRKRLSEMLIKNLSQFSTLVEKVRTYAN